MPMKRLHEEFSARNLRRRAQKETNADWKEIIGQINSQVETLQKDNEEKRVKHSLSLLSVTFLLLILRNNTDLELPKDGCTRQSDVTTMCAGKYCHYGVHRAIDEMLKKYCQARYRKEGTSFNIQY